MSLWSGKIAVLGIPEAVLALGWIGVEVKGVARAVFGVAVLSIAAGTGLLAANLVVEGSQSGNRDANDGCRDFTSSPYNGIRSGVY